MDRGVESYRQVVNRIRKTFPDMATEGESTLIENRRFNEREAERMADPRMAGLRAFWRFAP